MKAKIIIYMFIIISLYEFVVKNNLKKGNNFYNE